MEFISYMKVAIVVFCIFVVLSSFDKQAMSKMTKATLEQTYINLAVMSLLWIFSIPTLIAMAIAKDKSDRE